jgi:hypothetical protein
MVMEKKKLWLALSALSASMGISAAEQESEKAGVASAVQPQAEVESKASRVLFVGNDVFRNEVIRTDASGVTHLLFLDKSSLTVGPDSIVTIDKYVYNPETDSGELVMTATRGVLRFVGGSLSKKKPVTIKTPLGTLGIRGGGMLARIEANLVQAFLFYGDFLSGESSISDAKKVVAKLEHGLELHPDGSVIDAILDQQFLDWVLDRLSGPAGEQPRFAELPLPGTFNELRGFQIEEDKADDIQDFEKILNFS